MKGNVWALAAAVVILPLVGCGAEDEARLSFPLGGDEELGQQLLYSYACTSCHAIPGVRGREGTTGPLLDRFGSRSYVAGVLPNTPENLIKWIMDPQAINPGTAMPSMAIPEVHAQHMAAYLTRLR